MKIRFASLFIILPVIFCLSSCELDNLNLSSLHSSSSNQGTTTSIDTSSNNSPNLEIECSEASRILVEGETVQLFLYVNNKRKEDNVIWSSSDNYVATVGLNGLVNAKNEGKVTISATIEYDSRNFSAFIDFDVLDLFIEATSIEFNESNIELEPNEQYQLETTILPENSDERDVVFESSNPDIVSVDENGLIMAHAVGEATITAAINERVRTQCQVYVIQPRLIILNEDPSLFIGQQLQLNIELTRIDTEVYFESNNINIVTVDNDGLITAHSEGIVAILARTTYKGMQYSDLINVTVIRPTLSIDNYNKPIYKGNSFYLEYTSNFDYPVNWTSYDNNIASINDDGLVKTYNPGYVTISVEADLFGYSYYDSISLYVSDLTVAIVYEDDVIFVGNEMQLNYLIDPDISDENHTIVSWKSSDEEIAFISDSGLLKTLKTGDITITLTVILNDTTYTDSVNIEVVDADTYYTPGLTFKLMGTDLYHVTGYTGNKDIVYIPALYRNKMVVGIAESAFEGNTDIKEIYIASILSTIYSNAFKNCKSIQNIVIYSVRFIETSAFEGCLSLETLKIQQSYTTNIGERAFYNCKLLTEFYITDLVETIGNEAFYGCSNLIIYSNQYARQDGWSYNFNNGRPTVWGYAGINDVYNGVKYALSINEEGEESIVITGRDNTSQSNNLIIPDCIQIENRNIPVKIILQSSFYSDNYLTSIIIGNNVTSIENYAFYSCNYLTEVNFKENSKLETINNGAFERCNFTTFVLPDSVLEIGSEAFSHCSKLETFIITEHCNLKKIGTRAFEYCGSFKEIYLLPQIEIGSNAFYHCNSLIVYYAGEPDYNFNYNYGGNTIVINSYLAKHGEYNGYQYAVCIDTNDKKYITITGYNGIETNIEIPEYITFENEQLPVKIIGEYVFASKDIVSVSIPDSVVEIYNDVFSDCSKLETVNISENSSLFEISYRAFENCSALKSIYIPGGVNYVGFNAFDNCSLLTIYFAGDIIQMQNWNSEWNIDNNKVVYNSYLAKHGNYNGLEYLILIDENNLPYVAITNYTSNSDERIVIPDRIENIDVKVIESGAFKDNILITSIYIPSSVTTIGDDAFLGCINLTICFQVSEQLDGFSTDFNPSNCKIIWNSYLGIQGNYNGLEYAARVDENGEPYIVIYGYNGIDNTIFIPNSIENICVKVIEENAFADKYDIGVIYIPTSVTLIENNAFSNCYNLTIYLQASQSEVSFPNNWNLSNANFGMYIPVNYGCIDFKSSDGYSYFVCNYDSEDKYIAIYDYSGLDTNIYIPEYINVNDENIIVKVIEAYAFNDNSKLVSVVISNSITKIGSHAFYNCFNLNYIYIPNSVEYIGENAIRAVNVYCEAIEAPNNWHNIWNVNAIVYFGCYFAGTYNGFNYIAMSDSQGNKTIAITGYVGDDVNLTIPEYINVNGENVLVTSIVKYAFNENLDILTIYIPDSIINIPMFGFYNCLNLQIYCEATSKPDGYNNYWANEEQIHWNISYEQYLQLIQ